LAGGDRQPHAETDFHERLQVVLYRHARVVIMFVPVIAFDSQDGTGPVWDVGTGRGYGHGVGPGEGH